MTIESKLINLPQDIEFVILDIKYDILMKVIPDSYLYVYQGNKTTFKLNITQNFRNLGLDEYFIPINSRILRLTNRRFFIEFVLHDRAYNMYTSRGTILDLNKYELINLNFIMNDYTIVYNHIKDDFILESSYHYDKLFYCYIDSNNKLHKKEINYDTYTPIYIADHNILYINLQEEEKTERIDLNTNSNMVINNEFPYYILSDRYFINRNIDSIIIYDRIEDKEYISKLEFTFKFSISYTLDDIIYIVIGDGPIILVFDGKEAEIITYNYKYDTIITLDNFGVIYKRSNSNLNSESYKYIYLSFIDNKEYIIGNNINNISMTSDLAYMKYKEDSIREVDLYNPLRNIVKEYL